MYSRQAVATMVQVTDDEGLVGTGTTLGTDIAGAAGVASAPGGPGPAHPPADGASPLVDAVLGATRALVGVAARSLALLGEDVTLPQFRALVILSVQGSQRLAELAQALRVDPSTATRMCDRLVRKQLVHRRRTSDDRRGVRISLAPPGRDLVDQVTQRRRAEIAEILARLDPARCDEVLLAMEAFAQAAGELAPDDWALGWSTTTEPPVEESD
jgi:DNA-binding MarR family transcriptional regulator